MLHHYSFIFEVAIQFKTKTGYQFFLIETLSFCNETGSRCVSGLPFLINHRAFGGGKSYLHNCIMFMLYIDAIQNQCIQPRKSKIAADSFAELHSVF